MGQPQRVGDETEPSALADDGAAAGFALHHGGLQAHHAGDGDGSGAQADGELNAGRAEREVVAASAT